MRGTSSKSSAERLRGLPWIAVAQGAAVIGRRIGRLSVKERRRLGTLLRESRGWPGSLSERDRAELRKLLGKLDLGGMWRDLASLRGRGRRRR